MENLVRAFQIFLKYSRDEYPTSCEHDVMYVHVSPSVVSTEDKAELDRLGFYSSEDEGLDLDNFLSYRYGSA